jgi:photosystem II stability/assembly factor-like uncharacterized protein
MRRVVILALAVVALGGATASSGASRSAEPQTSMGFPAPIRFEPAAASFVSTKRGWMLGRFGCGNCAAVRRTEDGGRTWTSLPSPHELLWPYTASPPGPRNTSPPPKAVSHLVFADSKNGFLFAPDLLITRDGGRSWVRQSLSRVVREVEIGGGYAYAMTESDPSSASAWRAGPASIWRTPIGSEHWTKLSSPRAFDAEIAVEGKTIVLLETGFHGPGPLKTQLGRIWVSGDRGEGWRSRPMPCTTRDDGAALVSVVPGHSASWLLDCYDNRQSMQAQWTQHHLFRTTNMGRSWVRLSDPTRHNGPSLLAANGAGHIFLATEGGGGDVLVGSLDGGGHWRPLLNSGGAFFGWSSLRFVTPMTGFVVGPTHYAPEHLYRTDDGGRTWRPMPVR